MPIKNGKHARHEDIVAALKQYQPFPRGVQVTVVLPTAYPNLHHNYKGRKHRAYIADALTSKILVTAPSAYALLEKIESGWKYEPGKKQGLWNR